MVKGKFTNKVVNLLGTDSQSPPYLAHIVDKQVNIQKGVKNYATYLIQIYQPTKTHAKPRRWVTNKRYSEFLSLYKTLEKRSYNLPPFPPKKFIGNLNASHLEQRKLELQGFLDFCLKNALNELEVKEFIQSEYPIEHNIYQVPDEIFVLIFKYLDFHDLFNRVALVCKWWRYLLYGAFTSLDFSRVHGTIYFSHIPLSIKSVPALGELATQFYAIQSLKLERFLNATDDIISSILDNCPKVKALMMRSMGISEFNIKLSQLKKLTIVSCPKLTSLSVKPSASSLENIKISQCLAIDGKALSKAMKQLKVVTEADFSGNESVTEIEIESASLLRLNLSFCSNLYTTAGIHCQHLSYLNLSYTVVYDRSLTTCLSYSPQLQHLHCIGVSTLFHVEIPNICQALQTLHFSGCASLITISIETIGEQINDLENKHNEVSSNNTVVSNKDNSSLNKEKLEKLEFIDLRICSALDKETVLPHLLESSKVIKEILYDDKNYVEEQM